MIVKRGKQINDKIENLHVIVTIDGTDYPFNHAAPIGLTDIELQKFAEVREPEYIFDILRDLYPDAPALAKTDLETLEHWIADGAIIPPILDNEGNEIEPERIAEKIPWTITHPVVKRALSQIIDLDPADIQAFKNATTVTQVKAILQKILIGS